MTPRKLKIILTLATLCVVLFGVLFRIMTKATVPGSENVGEIQTLSIDGTGNTSSLEEEIGLPTTGTITEIKGTDPEPVDTSSNTTSDITILLPGRFYNNGFQELAQTIKKKYNLTIHYKKIDNIGYYKKIIKEEEKIDGIDLYLLPTDWLVGYEGKIITLNEDIAPYVHPIFTSYATNTTTLLPYAIDPLVTLTPASTLLNFENQLTFQDIANFIALENKTNKIKMPILRGIDKNDKKILEQGNESYPNYFILTYKLIQEIYKAGQESNYSILLNTINNPSISKRSYANFKITFNRLLAKNSNCIIFPDICIIAYNLGDIKFGFLSDTNIQEKYFGGTGGKITELKIYNFPTETNEYKVRGRGFVANSKTKNDKAIKIFAEEYIKAGVENSMPLWQDTLSAFNNVLDIQKIQKKYELLFQFEPQFSLMLYPTNLQQQFLQNTNFLNMIQEKNPATGVGGFFEPTNWAW